MAKRIASPKPAPRPPSRVNKRTFVTFVSPEAHKQLKQLALDTDMSGQELGREAVNLLFKEHQLKQIA